LFVAAHCFKPKYSGITKTSFEINAWVGKQNLHQPDETFSKPLEVWVILVHEDWDYTAQDFDADIAILVLKTEVDLSRPSKVGVVCLPQPTSNPVTGNGYIVGWGLNEWTEANRELHSITPKELRLPVVTNEVCFEADERLEYLTSPRTFCAGFEDQEKSACSGDSGGGFFQLDRITKSYILSGIVSSSLRDIAGGCRKDIYSVFTNVVDFADWIQLKMQETENIKWKKVIFGCEEKASG
jgi:secreted trypsin-like serine protease